jgi:hypothetical protein
MRRSWSAAIASAPIALLVLAGCASSATKQPQSQSPSSSAPASGDNATMETKNFTADVFAAVKAADSFRVVGTGKDNGTTYALDIHFGTKGGSGFFSEGSQRFDLSGKAGIIYVKASAATWKAAIGARPDIDKVAAKLAGHWVMVPSTGSDLAQLGDYVDRDKFVASFSRSSTSSGPFRKAGTATVSGTDAVAFVDQSDQSKVYIAAHGAPLLLKVEAPASQGGGALTFSAYDEPFTPIMPAPADVIDLASVVK